MATISKSVRVDANILQLFEDYFDITNRIFQDTNQYNFSEITNIALKCLLGSYAEGLERILHDKGYDHRDKTGKIVFTQLSDEDLITLDSFVQNALGMYYSWLSEE